MTQKSLLFLSANKEFSIVFYLVLIPALLEKSYLFEKSSRNFYPVLAHGFASGAMVFALMKEVIAF